MLQSTNFYSKTALLHLLHLANNVVCISVLLNIFLSLNVDISTAFIVRLWENGAKKVQNDKRKWNFPKPAGIQPKVFSTHLYIKPFAIQTKISKLMVLVGLLNCAEKLNIHYLTKTVTYTDFFYCLERKD